jgi:hypothetical protein
MQAYVGKVGISSSQDFLFTLLKVNYMNLHTTYYAVWNLYFT